MGASPLLHLHGLSLPSPSSLPSPPSPWSRHGCRRQLPQSSMAMDADCHRCCSTVERAPGIGEWPSSAMAVAAAIAAAAASASASSAASQDSQFMPRKVQPRPRAGQKGSSSQPSPEFVGLCQEQLSLCDQIFRHRFQMTVYVRAADSYGTADMELHHSTTFPGCPSEPFADASLLIGTFETAAALHIIEASLAEQDVIELPEYEALVLPMARDMFLIGFLVAEWMAQPASNATEHIMYRSLQSSWPEAKEPTQQQTVKDPSNPNLSREAGFFDDFSTKSYDIPSRPYISLATEQRTAIVKVAHSLAIACIMDQRTALLQQSSWQRGIQIGNLVEQVRGCLIAIRTLGKMLQPQLKRGEISSDIVDDILVHGDRMKDVVQQLQEVLYLRMGLPKQLNGNKFQKNIAKGPFTLDSSNRDSMSNTSEMRDLINRDEYNKQEHPSSIIVTGHLPERDMEAPMPPYVLPHLMDVEYRPCDVIKLLSELVQAGVDLVQQKGRTLELKQCSCGVPLFAAIDESALRQALCSLLDSSLQHTFLDGSIKLEAVRAPGGGVLVVIHNNGSQLSLMEQSIVPTPLGRDLVSQGGNILASIATKYRIVQDILEQFGGVLRVTSPYPPDASFGTGGTRLEVWLPAPPDKM